MMQLDRGVIARRARWALAAFGLALVLGSVASASAEDWRWRERERARREHEWRVHHEYHPYAYAPPAVIYAPPVQGPAINFVFPLR